MSREPGDWLAVAGAAQERVQRSLGLDRLQVAVAARVIVRKVNFRVVDVVGAVARRLGLAVPAVEEMRFAELAEIEQARAQVVVVAGEEQPAAARDRAPDRLRVRRAQSGAGVDREQPQFVAIGIGQRDKIRIVAIRADRSIARRDAELERFEMGREQREPPDMPVLLGEGNRRLEKNLLHAQRPTTVS